MQRKSVYLSSCDIESAFPPFITLVHLTPFQYSLTFVRSSVSIPFYLTSDFPHFFLCLNLFVSFLYSLAHLCYTPNHHKSIFWKHPHLHYAHFIFLSSCYCPCFRSCGIVGLTTLTYIHISSILQHPF